MAGEREVKVVIAGDAKGAIHAIDQTNSKLGSLGSGLGNVAQSIAKVGFIAMAGGAIAAAGGLGYAIKAAADFEQSLNFLKAVSGATGDEMKQISTLAKQLGADIKLPGVSAKDASEAMVELAKAGLSVTDVMGAARGVLQLATAGNLSNAKAAEIASNALNAFSLRGTEATRVADLLAAAANASSVEVLEVGDAMQMAAAVFASAKMPVEDLVTAIALMGNAGVKGSDAGTSLKQMLLQLEGPSKIAAKTMAAIGFSAYDSAGKMKPLREIIGDLTTATKGMTDQQRDFTLATIFGSDAVRAVNILMKEGAAGFDVMKGKVTEQGAAAELAAARMKGLNGALENIKSSAQTIAIMVGAFLLPILADLGTKAAVLIASLEPLINLLALGFNGGTIGGEWSKVEQAAFKAGQIFKWITVEIIPHFVLGIQTIAENFRKLPWEVQVALVVALGVAILALASPIVLVIAAMAALVIGIGYLRENWESITKAVNDVIEKIKEFPVFGEIVQAQVAIVVAQFTALKGSFVAVVNVIDALIHGEWGAAWEAFKDLVQVQIDLVTDIFRIFVDTVGGVLGDLAVVARDAMIHVLNAIAGMAGDFLEWGRRLGQNVIDGMIGAAKAGIGKVTSFLNPLDSPPGFHEMPGKYLDFGKKLGSSMVEGVSAGLDEIGRRTKAFMDELDMMNVKLAMGLITTKGDAGLGQQGTSGFWTGTKWVQGAEAEAIREDLVRNSPGWYPGMPTGGVTYNVTVPVSGSVITDRSIEDAVVAAITSAEARGRL